MLDNEDLKAKMLDRDDDVKGEEYKVMMVNTSTDQ